MKGTTLGPLGGRSHYLPHVPWFNFPAETASALPYNTIRPRTGLYFMNAFRLAAPSSKIDSNTLDANGRLSPEDQEKLIVMDYESIILEFGADWQIFPRIRFSMDWRIHTRFGGGSDPIIEWWHYLLSTDNAGREYCYQNQSRWKVQSDTGINYSGEEDITAIGDLDLRSYWTLLIIPDFKLALGGAFKIPIGTVEGGFSSGHPDLGTTILIDWNPFRRWAFYFNAGIIFPLDAKARVFTQFVPAVEFRISQSISAVLQFNIQSSPFINSNTLVYTELGIFNHFYLPQTDIKIGIKGQHGQFEWQIYIEEEPITWEGPDILMYFGIGYKF